MAEKQPITKSVTTLSLLQLFVALINGLFIGWIMLVCWFVFLWWQHDDAYASHEGVMWVEAVNYHWSQVLASTSASTQQMIKKLTQTITTQHDKWTGEIQAQTLHANKALDNDMSVTQNNNNNQIKNMFSALQQGWKKLANLLLYATTMLLINMALLILAMPLFLLSVFVGFADGLMMRSIRKASLGRESAYLFHKLSSLFSPLLQFMIAVFVVLSAKASPSYFLVSMATVMGCWVAQTVSRFKKYL